MMVKGKAMKFTLIPVSILRQIWKLNAKRNSFVKTYYEKQLKNRKNCLDTMNLIEQKLNDIVL